MKNKVISLVFVCMLAFACGTENEQKDPGTSEALGGVTYGGVFKVNEVEDFRSLFPHNITEVTAHRITNQVYEGLVRFDQADLSILPSLAESWEVNDEATVYTFKIRQGVTFHDDPCFPNGKGRALTAHDVGYCFNMLCTTRPDNQLCLLYTSPSPRDA